MGDGAEVTTEKLQSCPKRTRADFQDYKRRTKERRSQIKDRTTEGFAERVVTIHDNLIRTLDRDENADIHDNLESTLREFDRILEGGNIKTIDPEPGTDVDPNHHEVMMRIDSDQSANTVADVFQPGYKVADEVIHVA